MSPGAPFSPNDTAITFRPQLNEDTKGYPLRLKEVRSYLIGECKRKYGLQGYAGEDDVMPRLDSVECVGGSMDTGIRLHLRFSLTTFGSMWASNGSLDYRVIPRNGLLPIPAKSIRDAYCMPVSGDLSGSVLANAVGVEIAVIARNSGQDSEDQLIVRCRSDAVLFHRGHFQVSAAGYLSLNHFDVEGMPSPFVTAVIETREEVADSLLLAPGAFRLLGLAVKWEDLHPAFFGYIETNRAVSELLSDSRKDQYEGTLYAIPFRPSAVLSHIASNRWTPHSALAAIAALLAFYPREEVYAIAGSVPLRAARSFFEQSD